MKLKNGPLHYHDHDLVFAQTWENGPHRLGEPLTNIIIKRIFKDLIEKTGVRRITPHGTRHTCATLSLNDGMPVHVVSRQLGHRNIQTTLSTYAHIVEGQEAETAVRRSAAIFGAKKQA